MCQNEKLEMSLELKQKAERKRVSSEPFAIRIYPNKEYFFVYLKLPTCGNFLCCVFVSAIAVELSKNLINWQQFKLDILETKNCHLNFCVLVNLLGDDFGASWRNNEDEFGDFYVDRKICLFLKLFFEKLMTNDLVTLKTYVS